MRIPQPNWELAKLTKDKYAEDGVQGEVGFDSETGEWYVDLDEGDYKEYMANLRKRQGEVLTNFAKPWKGVNIQGQATEPPKDNENRLALYIVDASCGTAHGFGVKYTLTDVFQGKAAYMFFGSTCDSCGKKMMAVLQWEDVKPSRVEKA